MKHSAVDGKGDRDVYLNGKKLEHVVWADDRRGRVLCRRYPYVLDRAKGRTRNVFYSGKVEVVSRG